jgi:agmatinase
VEDVIAPSDLAMIGIRSWEAEEIFYLKEHPEITVIRAKDIHEHGYRKATEDLLEKFKTYDALYLTLDIDVLDPSCAPGTGTPEPGGPSCREIMEIVKILVRKLPIKAMDVVEVSPPLDTPNHITAWAALKIIYEVFGQLSLNNNNVGSLE